MYTDPQLIFCYSATFIVQINYFPIIYFWHVYVILSTLDSKNNGI